MRYTVVWTPKAEQDLAGIWMAAQIGGESRSPQIASIVCLLMIRKSKENRAGMERVIFVPPLAASYEVLEADRIARILGVWGFE